MLLPVSLPWTLVAMLSLVVVLLLMERSMVFDDVVVAGEGSDADAIAGSFSTMWRNGAPVSHRSRPEIDSKPMSVLVTGAAGFGAHTNNAATQKQQQQQQQQPARSLTHSRARDTKRC